MGLTEKGLKWNIKPSKDVPKTYDDDDDDDEKKNVSTNKLRICQPLHSTSFIGKH